MARLTRRATLAPDALAVPGSAVLTKSTVDPEALGDATPVIVRSTREAGELLEGDR